MACDHPSVRAVRKGMLPGMTWRGGCDRFLRHQAVCRDIDVSQPAPCRHLDRSVARSRPAGRTRLCAWYSPRELESSEPNRVARGVQLWLREHLKNPSRHVAGQACWALVEAMSPAVAVCLSDGAARHFDLRRDALGYFRIGMKSRRGADRYAANLLTSDSGGGTGPRFRHKLCWLAD